MTATGGATFNTKNVATANLVTVNSTALADGINGGVASNYSLATGQTIASTITAKALTATLTTVTRPTPPILIVHRGLAVQQNKKILQLPLVEQGTVSLEVIDSDLEDDEAAL